MTLDSLLAEVGPILGSSQFSHPSFREVLAARHFADEINSGRLNVKHAAHAFWLYDPGKDMARIQDEYFDDIYPTHIEFRPAHVVWKTGLNHMAEMLYADKAREFVDVICEFHGKRICEGATNRKEDALNRLTDDFQLRQYCAVVDDMRLCAKFIVAYPTSDTPKGNSRKVLDTLLSTVENFIDEPEVYAPDTHEDIENQARMVLNELALVKSSYVLQKLVGYVGRFKRQRLHGLVLETREKVMDYDVFCAVKELALSGVQVSEEFLVNNLQECAGDEYPYGIYVFDVVGILGGLKCLEELIGGLTHLSPVKVRSRFRGVSNYFSYNYFSSIFNILKRHDFDPKLIKQFNDELSKWKDDYTLMKIYSISIQEFAQDFKKDTGSDLYEHLEKNKMQFWDYWRVYKPK